MKKIKYFIFVFLLTVSFTACADKDKGVSENNDNKNTQEMMSGNGNDGIDNKFNPNQAMESTATLLDTSDMFTDRDLNPAYDKAEEIVLSDSGSTSTSSNVSVEGNTITINKEGIYHITGSLSDGMIIVDSDKTEKIQLVLDGVTIHSDTSAAIYVRQADKVFVTLAEGSVNELSSGESYVAIDDNNIDAVIFSKDDLTLNGSGALTITSPAGHGIVSKDDLAITGGDYHITAKQHGLAANDSVRIADGTYEIDVKEDGIHADDSDDTTTGFVYIENGSLTINAGDDGIHGTTNIKVAGGSIDIPACYEGIEARVVEIAGGSITIVSSDDGLNAASGSSDSTSAGGGFFDADSGAAIIISGGIVSVDAEGDGIDSNGSLEISGGTVYVAGPVSDGDGALDYGTTAKVTGGTIVMYGSSGMAVNFSEAEQGTIMTVVDTQQAGTDICIKDAAGKEIVSLTTKKKYSAVIISSPDIKEGETYTLTAGAYSETITMDSLLVGGSGMGGGMMPGHGGKFDGNMPSQGQQNGEPPQMPDGGAPNMQNQGQSNGEPPQMPDGDMQQKPDGKPPQMPNGDMPNGEAPNMQNQGQQNGEPPQMPDNGSNGQSF
ncbi:MAG: carbohydrate-binding domain-containing protein [Clostridium sp.]|nr:carbohydrate-binding domain-containing protein [Clostridium sp.]MCM1173339.1 carbohydrate-binding domain-containing protein [Clostridium sp.]MCM1209568.1 carbohydrate-binding domain-containing protein [Ruminococcus sp.]